MAASKYHRHIGIIFALSFLLTLLLFFVDESRYSLDFLTKVREIFMVIFFSLLFAGAPLAIYGFTSDRRKTTSFRFSIIGFLPPLAILYWLIF